MFRSIVLHSTKLDEPIIYFDRDNSYWPTALKADDPFDDNFKMTAVYESDTEPKDIPLVVYFRGNRILLATARLDPGRSTYFTWVEEPLTAREFFEEVLGAKIEESTTFSLQWETGYMISDTEFVRTDYIPTQIYVEVPKIDIVKYALVGTCVIGVAAFALGVVRGR